MASRSTHQPEIGIFGENWLGKHKDIYVTSNTKRHYNTLSELPPQRCFNCTKLHWRKDCPRSMYHNTVSVPKRRKLIVYDDEDDE